MAFELRFLDKKFEFLRKNYENTGEIIYSYVKNEIMHDPKRGELFYITFLDKEELWFSLFKGEEHFDGLRVRLFLSLYFTDELRLIDTREMTFGEIKGFLRYLFDSLETRTSCEIGNPGDHWNSMIHNDFVNLVKY